MPTVEFLSLLCLGGLAWFWFSAARAREAALAAARQACESEGLLLLDETVVNRGLRLQRDSESRLRLRRVYDFEYSDTGDNRRKGSVVLLGDQVIYLNVGLRLVPMQRVLH